MWLSPESPSRLALCPCAPTVQVPARRHQPTAQGGGPAPVLPSPTLSRQEWGMATARACSLLLLSHVSSQMELEGSDTAAAW